MKVKLFWADWVFILEKTDDISKLYIISVDNLLKARKVRNKYIIKKESSGRYHTKNESIDIYTHVDSSYQMQFTNWLNSEPSRMYLLQNQSLVFLQKNLKQVNIQLRALNKLLSKAIIQWYFWWVLLSKNWENCKSYSMLLD